ncbi:MAG: hypothetical protein QXE22_05935 [Candidatus Bathyarchaeia archaeon]
MDGKASTSRKLAEPRIDRVVEALNRGGSPSKVCGSLDWWEFEWLIFEAFRLNGFEVLKGFTFTTFSKKRFQIDILALKLNILMSVDCKQWMFPYWSSRIHAASKAHLRRTEALAGHVKHLKAKLPLRGLKKLYLIPVMLTLGDSKIRDAEGIPVVSVLKLKDFLYRFPDPPSSGFKYYIAYL